MSGMMVMMTSNVHQQTVESSAFAATYKARFGY